MAENLTTIVGSETKGVTISRDLPTVIVGERLNPTGRKKLEEELKEHKFDIVGRDTLAQEEIVFAPGVRIVNGKHLCIPCSGYRDIKIM